MPRRPRYSEAQLREAVAVSKTLTEVLRRLGLRPAGGNHRVLRCWLERWEIAIDHFDADAARRTSRPGRTRPLEEVLVEGSSYSRRSLKERLYREGRKARRCEFCGQGETWRGRPMSLILDHINGVPDDNRIHNLRVLCPNCAATLETHCGRNARATREARACLLCGASFTPRAESQRYCSQACGYRRDRSQEPQNRRRKAERPPYDPLLAQLAESSYVAVARSYGVSDNAVRKWVRAYERQLAPKAPPLR